MNQIDEFVMKSIMGVCCPNCQYKNLAYEANESTLNCDKCGQSGATIYIRENRLDWFEGSRPESIPEEIETEVRKWDDWSKAKKIDPDQCRNSDLHQWFAVSEPMRWVLRSAPLLTNMRGKRILDIGGSCQDTWRFVKGGAERLDQVEPSPGSQRLAMKRLNTTLGSNTDWREHVYFHTCAAEALPFEDGVFDVVFSRSTIHHTQRPRSIEEIYRVLRKDGIMFIIEPRLTTPFYFLMKVSRWIRRVDRGTDDPLRPFEIRHMRRLFGKLQCYTTGLGIEKMEWLLRRLAGQTIRPGTLVTARWGNRIGQIPFLSNIASGKCYIVAEKV